MNPGHRTGIFTSAVSQHSPSSASPQDLPWPLLLGGKQLNKRSYLTLLTVRELLTGPLQRGHYLRFCGQFRLWFLCVISADKNLYRCFGCDSGGSVLDWLLHTERLRFLRGILWLRQLNGTTYVRPASSPPVARQILTDLDDDGQALLHQATDFYHRNLPDNEGAQGWLAARALSCGAGGRLVRELRSTEPWPGVAALRASRAMADHMIKKRSARHL